MDNVKLKPGRYMYVLAGIVFIASIILFGYLIISSIMAFTKDFTPQLLVPGEHIVELKEAGGYDVFIEKRTVYEGRVIETGSGNGLVCTIVDTQTGKPVKLDIKTSESTYEINGREGVSIFHFTIEKPGSYTFEAHYENDNTEELIMTIGKMNMGQMFGSIGLAVATLFGGILIPIGIVIFTMIKRQDYKSKLESGEIMID